MKSILLLISCSLLSFFTIAQETKPNLDLNGLWADSNSTAFTNCYLIIAQEGEKISMSHFLEFNGVPMVESGIGTYSDRKAFFYVTVSKPIPGWATTGKHFLTLSADGNTLRGEYQDASGNRGPLVFKRKK